MVSSTTPRFGPRWPLVLVTVSTSTSRISLARMASCSWESSFEVLRAGDLLKKGHG